MDKDKLFEIIEKWAEIGTKSKALSKILDNYDEDTSENPPFEMNEKKLPVYMLGQEVEINLEVAKTEINILIIIEQDKKNNTINQTIRLRQESTSHKFIFRKKEKMPLTNENILGAKLEAGMILNQILNLPYHYKTNETVELNFEPNDTEEEILKKIKDSNAFDVTKINNPE